MPSFFQNLFKKESDEPEAELPEGRESGQNETPSLLSAMNLPSPFAISAEEHFTVRELSILLPPQFVRQEGIPGDQPVNLPMDLLRASLQQGRPALKLSQIYLACPFLFTRQVQPSEDEEIVLPFQKVKRMVDLPLPAGPPVMGSPFAPISPPGAPAPRADSPFGGQQGSPFVQGSPAVGGSPFAAPRPAAESPFATRSAETPEGREVLSPFAGAGPSETPAKPSPFARPETSPPPAGASPFNLVTPVQPPDGAPFATPGGNGFGPPPTGPMAPPLQASSNPFGVKPPVSAPSPFSIRPQAAEPVPVPEPVSAPEPVPAAPEATRTVKVSLASLLRDITAEDLGFDPTAVPGTVEVELSLDTVLPQLSTGRVEVSIDEMRHGVVERFRPAFARAKSGLRFVVPLSEIFQNLPPEAIPAAPPAEHVPINTSPFQTPFAIKADEDRTRISQPTLPQITGSVPVPAAPPPAALAPFPVTPPAPDVLPAVPAPNPAAEAAPPKQQGMPALPKLPSIPGISGRPSPFSRPPGSPTPAAATDEAPSLPPMASLPSLTPPAAMPSLSGAESHDDLGQPFSASSLRAEPPAAPAAEPFDAARLFIDSPAAPVPAAPVPAPTLPFAAPVRPAPAPAPLPVPPAAAPKPAAQRPASSGPAVEFSFGETEDPQHLYLRAMFMTAGTPTPGEIALHCSTLPGLRTCIVISPSGIIHGSPESLDEEVRDFNNHAPRAHEYLTGLAQSMGFESQGSFTLRSSSVIRTFFIERHLCLAVLHTEEGFLPGVREKLILTARSLADMLS